VPLQKRPRLKHESTTAGQAQTRDKRASSPWPETALQRHVAKRDGVVAAAFMSQGWSDLSPGTQGKRGNPAKPWSEFSNGSATRSSDEGSGQACAKFLSLDLA